MPENAGKWLQLKKSLWELEEFCIQRGVRIAVENRPKDKFVGIESLLAENPADFLGLCYDSGHGNIGGKGLEHLDRVKDRLISVHLHDNDGLSDQHKPVFTGTVDWAELTRIVGDSPYDEFLTLETDMRHSGFRDEEPFLASAHADGLKLLQMM
jgi:sugar phosphate isomerase/epimerase